MKLVTAILLVLLLLPSFDAFGQVKAPTREPTLAEKLDAKVSLDFQETPLREAVNFFAQFSGVTFLIDPQVFQEKSMDELLVTLRADNITIKNAIELVTLTKTLAYDIRWGGVFISTEKRPATLPKTVQHFFPSPEDRALIRRLNEGVTFSFDGAPVSDVLAYIRTLKAVNIIVDDAIKARADEIAVTQDVTELPIRGALCVLLLPHGLTWEVRGGVVFVRAHLGSEEPTWERAASRILGETPAKLDTGDESPAEALMALRGKCLVPLCADPALPGEQRAAVKANDISLKSAISLLAKTNNLAWDLRWGGVFLTTPERQAAMPKVPLPPPARGAPAWKVKLHERLQGHVSFAFDGTEMSEALEFLRKLWKLNLVVHPEAREDVDSVVLSLKVNDLKLEYALAHLLFPYGLRFELTDEVVLITRAE